MDNFKNLQEVYFCNTINKLTLIKLPDVSLPQTKTKQISSHGVEDLKCPKNIPVRVTILYRTLIYDYEGNSYKVLLVGLYEKS